MSKESVKLIMLDIDGVLNSQQYADSLGNAWNGNQIDPLAVAKLNKVNNIKGNIMSIYPYMNYSFYRKTDI